MRETCTVLMQDNSYKVGAEYASLIREARERGDEVVSIVPHCECGAMPASVTLQVRDVVSVIRHGRTAPEPQTNVVPFRR
jgi:hypothetical protein